MPRVTGRTDVPRSFPIRPMYGIAIRDDLHRFRGDIGQSAQQIRDALATGKPRGKVVSGDGTLQGKEYTYAKTALKELDKALKSLKGVQDLPSFTPAPATATRDFPIRPMYGIAIRDDLQRFRNSINTNIAELKTAIKKGDASGRQIAGDGRLQGKELEYAKKALTQLEAAAKALKSVPISW